MGFKHAIFYALFLYMHGLLYVCEFNFYIYIYLLFVHVWTGVCAPRSILIYMFVTAPQAAHILCFWIHIYVHFFN